MFANIIKRSSVTLLRSPNVFAQLGKTNSFSVPLCNRYFATNVRDDKQSTKKADLETPTKAASPDNTGIGSTQGKNWKEAAKNEPVGGVRVPLGEETKDKIKDAAGNTARSEAGKSAEWAAPGSAKDNLKNPENAGKKSSLADEEKHYAGTAGSQNSKGQNAKKSGRDADKEPAKDSVHDTDSLGRGTTYVGIKGSKPDHTANQSGGTPDVSGGTTNQYPGDSSEGNARNATGTSRSDNHSKDAPKAKSGNAQDANVGNLGRGGSRK